MQARDSYYDYHLIFDTLHSVLFRWILILLFISFPLKTVSSKTSPSSAKQTSEFLCLRSSFPRLFSCSVVHPGKYHFQLSWHFLLGNITSDFRGTSPWEISLPTFVALLPCIFHTHEAICHACNPKSVFLHLWEIYK